MQTVESTGGGITRPLVEAARKQGVDLHTSAAMEDFIRDENGRVIGLVVREKFNFLQKDSGLVPELWCKKRDSDCIRRFSQNVQFRKAIDPSLDENSSQSNHPGATGECLMAMLALGAMPIQLDQIQLGPWSSPDERGFGLVSVQYYCRFSKRHYG